MLGLSMKSIILCADDYALTQPICDGVIALIEKKHLNATSCMVNTPLWEEQAKRLEDYVTRIQIGLHFALTDLKPNFTPQYKLTALIKQAYFRQLSFQKVQDEWRQQIEIFHRARGRLPDFIDGHQHIHQLPIIRDALLSIYPEYFPKQSCWIRIPISQMQSPKSLLIKHLGALTLRKKLNEKNIPHNTSFSGIYSFDQSSKYEKHFEKFLKETQHRGLIMCHPAALDIADTDRILKSRNDEFLFLMSDEFDALCQRNNINLS